MLAFKLWSHLPATIPCNNDCLTDRQLLIIFTSVKQIISSQFNKVPTNMVGHSNSFPHNNQ